MKNTTNTTTNKSTKATSNLKTNESKHTRSSDIRTHPKRAAKFEDYLALSAKLAYNDIGCTRVSPLDKYSTWCYMS